jgi:hypothetical protein
MIRQPLGCDMLEKESLVPDANPSALTISHIDGLGRDLRGKTKAIGNRSRGRDNAAAGLSTDGLSHRIGARRDGDAKPPVGSGQVVQPTTNALERASTDESSKGLIHGVSPREIQEVLRGDDRACTLATDSSENSGPSRVHDGAPGCQKIVPFILTQVNRTLLMISGPGMSNWRPKGAF